MKVKQVKYERLESDPHGYNNTKIGMIADVDEKDNPTQVLNKLREIVLERHNAYNEVREANIKIKHLGYNLSHIKDSLHQLKIDDDTKLKLDELKENINDHEEQIQKLKHRINTILG